MAAKDALLRLSSITTDIGQDVGDAIRRMGFSILIWELLKVLEKRILSMNTEERCYLSTCRGDKRCPKDSVWLPMNVTT